MNTLPFEILEEIVAYIPIETLHNKCLVSRTWYNLVRNELYHKLKESIKEMDRFIEKYREFSTRLFDKDDPVENSILQLAIKYLEGEIKVEEDYQLDISENMLKYGMLVDEEERKKVKFDIMQREHLSGWDEYDTMSREYDTSENDSSDGDTSDEEIYCCTQDEWAKIINYF